MNDKEIKEKCKTLANLGNMYMRVLYTILATFYVLEITLK